MDYPEGYSAAQKKRFEYCFMKQKCQIQIGIAWYNKTKDWALVQTAALAINQEFNVGLG